MKITNLTFTGDEAHAILVAAALTLNSRDAEFAALPETAKLERLRQLTPPNLLRLALGFETRQRGGARLGTGNRNGGRKTTKKGR